MENDLTVDEVLALLSRLLCEVNPQVSEELGCACKRHPGLSEIVGIVLQLRQATAALSVGNLSEEVVGHGYVISNLKALRANLYHLVWQMSRVSKGDYTQRVDFMGEFSDSFNSMCERLQLQSAEMIERASRDPLTNLFNRLQLDRYLERLHKTASFSDLMFAVVMIDIDFFKCVNDAHGHDVGDAVLVGTAGYLKKVFRSSDFIARFGGEEFIAILPQSNCAQAIGIAQRLLAYFRANPIHISETIEIPITISIGISEYHSADESYQQVIKRSDMALYNAKRGGRDRLEVQ